MKKPTKASELVPDPKNANEGTDRGRALLKESIATVGFGRPVVADKHNTLIAGNKTAEAAVAAGAEIEVVDLNGGELLVHQRTDLSLLRDPKARKAAYYDNRTSEVGLHWSKDQVKADVLAGVNLGAGFFPEEVKDITTGIGDVKGQFEGSEHLGDHSEPFGKSLSEPISPPEPTNQHNVRIAFENPEAHRRYLGLMFQLRARYPQLTSPMQRLLTYVQEAEGI